MRNHNGSLAVHKFPQSFLNQLFTFTVECARCFIEHQDGRPIGERAREREQLALADREVVAALAHRFVNFMLDEAVAYSNFVNFVGYTPPQKNIDAELLIMSTRLDEPQTERQDDFWPN